MPTGKFGVKTRFGSLFYGDNWNTGRVLVGAATAETSSSNLYPLINVVELDLHDNQTVTSYAPGENAAQGLLTLILISPQA